MWSLLTLSTVGYHLQPQEGNQCRFVKSPSIEWNFSPDSNGSNTLRAVRHLRDDDHHRPHPNVGLQLCPHLQEQAVEKQDQHEEEAAAGEGHQEDQHPAQPCFLQRDVRGNNAPHLKFPIAHFRCQGSPQRWSDPDAQRRWQPWVLRQLRSSSGDHYWIIKSEQLWLPFTIKRLWEMRTLLPNVTNYSCLYFVLFLTFWYNFQSLSKDDFVFKSRSIRYLTLQGNHKHFSACNILVSTLPSFDNCNLLPFFAHCRQSALCQTATNLLFHRTWWCWILPEDLQFQMLFIVKYNYQE